MRLSNQVHATSATVIALNNHVYQLLQRVTELEKRLKAIEDIVEKINDCNI